MNLLDPYFSKLTKSSCDSRNNKTLRWAELQINNDFELVNQLISLPHFSDNKNFISLLAKKIKTTDFSYLSNVSKENIEEEKIKIYKEIINS